MLYTDAPFITQADLALIESEIPDVAGVADIDLDTHIQLCIDEFADWLQAKQVTFSGYIPPFNVPSTASYALVNTLTQASNRTRVALSQILTTDGDYPGRWSAVKRTAVYETVMKFYRQASSRKEVDRYEKKLDLYRKELRTVYFPRLKARGVPIVNRPMAAPAAYQEFQAGTFDDTNLTRLNNISVVTDDPTVEVVVTWIDNRYYTSFRVNANAESGPGPIASLQLHSGDFAVVDISTLNAPNGMYRPSAIANIPIVPLNASGWNVYASIGGGPFILQNSSPIDYATKSFTVNPLLTTGFQLTNGQYADLSIPLPDLSFRG